MDINQRARAIFTRDTSAPAALWHDLTPAQQGEYRQQAREAEANLAILERAVARAAFAKAEVALRAVLQDPAASAWLREAVSGALERDPEAAAHDAATLGALLLARAAAARMERDKGGA